MLKGTT